MSKHSVSEAARLAGVSRSHFYKKFIRTGLISVERDKEDKPIIDTAEILRACGELKGKNTENVPDVQFDTYEIHNQNTALQTENQLLRELLNAKDKHISDLQQALRLLEHRPAPEAAKLEKEVQVLRKEFRFLGMRLWGGSKE